jgi:hypothetical protein
MADLPRWIDSDRVDSQAMYSAYFPQTKPTDPWFGHLKLILHRGPQPDGRMYGVKIVQCQAENCSRCAEGKGGYQFRWYCVRWEAGYLRLKRPNPDVWVPPKPKAN